MIWTLLGCPTYAGSVANPISMWIGPACRCACAEAAGAPMIRAAAASAHAVASTRIERCMMGLLRSTAGIAPDRGGRLPRRSAPPEDEPVGERRHAAGKGEQERR